MCCLHEGLDVFTEHVIKLPNGTESLQMMWPDHCVNGTPGCDFHPSLQIVENNITIPKGTNSFVESYSGFGSGSSSTELASILQSRGIKKVYCVGLAYDYCVGYTALDAVSEGFDCTIITNLCRGVGIDTSTLMTRKLIEKGVVLKMLKDLLI